MQCAYCGYENRPQALFCAHCGQALASASDVWPQPSREVQEPGPSTEEGENAQPLETLTPGEILAGRYEILEVMEAETPTAQRRYRARDWGRCVFCGAEDNVPNADYCSSCGAALDRPGIVVLVEEERHVPEGYIAHFHDRGCDYYVLSEESPHRDEPSPSVLWEWRYALATDVGQMRERNEDYVAARLYTESSGCTVGVFVVADGLGGQDSGEVASRLAGEAVWESLREHVWLPTLRGEEIFPREYEEALRAAVQLANERVYATRLAQASQMSTTLTVALVRNADAYIASVGDSRAYHWSAKGLARITKDHSLVQRLLDAGQIAPQEVYTHPQRNVIYHSIGDHPHIEVDVFTLSLEEGDDLILCSDGLWEMVRDEGLEEVLLAEPEPQRACRRLIAYANLAGGEDNISVIVAQWVRKNL